jgi:hypothetical protein
VIILESRDLPAIRAMCYIEDIVAIFGPTDRDARTISLLHRFMSS